MAKKYPMDLTKHNKLKKKSYLTLNQIEQNLKNNGYDEDSINLMKNKIESSQYIYGNFDSKKLIDVNKDLKILTSSATVPTKPKYEHIPKINEKIKTFKSLVTDIREHTRSNQTPNQLMRNAQEVVLNYSNNPTNINTSLGDLLDEYKEFKKINSYLYYDTEVFGGVNKYGKQDLLGMQEFTIAHVDKNNGNPIVKIKDSILFGLNPENPNDSKTIEKINSWISEYNNTKEMPYEGIAKVTLERLAKMGHDNTHINLDIEKGIAHLESFASSEDIGEIPNIDLIRKGLQKEIDIAKFNNKYKIEDKSLGKNGGIPNYIYTFYSMINDLNTNFTLGKNNIAADTKWINATSNKIYNSLSKEQKNYLESKFGKFFYNLNYGVGMIDQEAVFRASTAINGSPYSLEQLKLLNEKKLTQGKLESIGLTFFPELYKSGAAHSAIIDTIVGANYASKVMYEDGRSLMEKQLDDIQENYKLINRIVKNNDNSIPVFLATNSDMYGRNDFDFTYNQALDIIHFSNGLTVNEEGNIKNVMFTPGIKKGVSYTTNIYEFKPTKEMIESMKDIDYSFNENVPYYMLEMTPVLNKTITKDNKEYENRMYRLFTSADEAEAYLSNNFIYYADKNIKDGTYKKVEQNNNISEKAIGLINKATSIIRYDNNNMILKELTPDEIINKGTVELLNDSAVRTIRNEDYKKVEKYFNVRNYFESKGVNSTGKVKDYLAAVTSLNISKDVAKGKDLTLDLQEIKSDLIKIIGYINNDTDEYDIFPHTLRNFQTTYGYYSSYDNTLKRMYDLSSKSRNPQLAFQTYSRNLKNDIAEQISSNKDLMEKFKAYIGTTYNFTEDELINGISNLKTFGFDTNFFEFEMPTGFFNKSENNIIRLNLNPRKHYSLVKDLLIGQYGKNRYNNMTNGELENYGNIELVRFINYANHQKNTKGIFADTIKAISNNISDINPDDINISNNDLAEMLFNDIRKFRENNPFAGYKKDKKFMSALAPNYLINFAEELSKSTDIDLIEDSLTETTKMLSNVLTKEINAMEPEAIKNTAKDIVDSIMIKQLDIGSRFKNVKELAEFASNTYGYNKNIFGAVINKTYFDMQDIVKSIISPILTRGGNIIQNDNKLKVTFDNNNFLDITEYLPILQFNNGRLDTIVGNSTIMTGTRLDVLDAINPRTNSLDKNKVKFRSGLAAGRRNLRGLTTNIDMAIKNGNSPLDTIAFSLKNMAQTLRENPQSSRGNTISEMLSSVSNVNVEEVIAGLPYIYDEIINSELFDDETKEILTNAMPGIKKGFINSDIYQIIGKNLQNFIKFEMGIGEDELDPIKTDEFFIKNINLLTKDTAQAKFIYRIGEYNTSALAQLSNYKRPVPIQKLNARVYDKDKLSKYVETVVKNNKDESFKDLFLSNRLTTYSERKRIERKFGKTNTTSVITGLKTTIDDTSFHKIINDTYTELIKSIPESEKEKYEKAFSLLSGFSTYEGEKIINPRLGSELFRNADTQYININKEIISTLVQAKIDNETNREIMKKQTQIIPFVKVSSNGVITFKYGEEVYIKKYDTILTKEKYGDINSEILSNNTGYMKLRYYHKNSDIEVGSQEIQREINNLNTMSKEKIFDYLNNKYTPMISVERDVYKGFNKLYIDDEKGMTRFAAVGAGFLDDRIKNVLVSSGLNDKVNEIVKTNYLEKELNNITDINEILKENGFNEMSDFILAVKNEQNFIVDNIFSKIPGFRNSIIITNDNLAHHDNMAMYLKDMLDTAAYQKVNKILADNPNINREEAYKKAYGEVYDIINMSNPLWSFVQDYDENTGQIIFNSSNNPVIAKKDIKELQKNLGLNETSSIIYEKNGNKYGVSASRIMIAGPTEYAGSSNTIKDLKNVNNELISLERQVEIAHANNHEIDNNIISRIKELRQKRYSLQNLNRYMTVDERNLNTLYNQKYTSPEEIKELKEIWNNIGEGEFDKIFDGLFDKNLNLNNSINANVNQAIINNIENRIISDNDIPENNKKNIAYQLKQSNLAMMWNANPNDFISDEILKENGFKEISLNDNIFIPSGIGSPDLIKNEKSLLEKNLIIDVNGRKIAVPYEEASIVGDQVINTEKNQKLRSVSRYNNIIQEARKGSPLDNKPIEYYETKLNESVNDLLNVLKANNNLLDKDMRKVKLDGYTFSKLSGMVYHKGESGKFVNDTFYSTATFAGRTLGELAEQGVYINAGKTGLQFFKEQTDLFEQNTLDKLNMTEKQMQKYLMEHGTIGLFTRNPNVEKGSTSPMLLFLDPNTANEKISLVSELLNGVNGDVDGDNGALALVKFRGHDYATARLLSENNLGDEWKSVEQAIAYTALPNSRYRKNVESKLETDKKNILTTIDDMFGEGNNYYFGLPNRAYDSDELKKMFDLNNQITNATIEKIGKDKFNALNESETYGALLSTVNELDADKRGKAYEAISAVRSYAKSLITNISNSNKADIGFMDTPMNELVQLNKIINKDNSEATNAVAAITKILREKPISRKKDDTGKVSITRKFRESWMDATNGSASAANKVLSFIDTYKNDIVEFLRNNTTYPNNNTDEEAYNYARETISNILKETRENKNVQKALVGIRKTNYTNIKNKKYFSEDLPFGKIYSEMTNKIKITNEDIKNGKGHPDLKDFKKISSKEVLKESKEIVENINHGMSGLAVGALGLAAAIMVTGYVGGNPTKPADTQADEQNQSDKYDSLQDTDLQIQQLPQGTTRGYVININATSDKGKKHVQDAIQLAMQSSIPTDVNIQMNINDKTSNIDSKFIDKLLIGAL